jgi:hypothetical protein
MVECRGHEEKREPREPYMDGVRRRLISKDRTEEVEENKELSRSKFSFG